MEYVLLFARIFLAVVFLIAGIGKLLDLKGSKSAMLGFGLPESLAAPAAIALPIAELIAAILLIPKSTAWWGALLAFLLLAAFVGGIAYNMSKGRAPDCHCFGQIHSEPAGSRTLIRNGLLGAVALFIILFGTDRWSFSHGNAGASLLGWMGDLSTWEIIATLLSSFSLWRSPPSGTSSSTFSDRMAAFCYGSMQSKLPRRTARWVWRPHLPQQLPPPLRPRVSLSVPQPRPSSWKGSMGKF